MRVVGDTHVTNIYAAPPIREHTNISLGLCVNWGQLCFSAAWNRAAMTPDQCEEFLASLLDRMARLVAVARSLKSVGMSPVCSLSSRFPPLPMKHYTRTPSFRETRTDFFRKKT